MEKGLCVLFVGVFVGALGYELIRKTACGKNIGKQVTKGLNSVKEAFSEGYQGEAVLEKAEA